MRRISAPSLEVQTEIDLAPMLALMVTLIPILLLSSVFVQISVINTSLPQAVRAAVTENQLKNQKVIIQQKSDYSFSITNGSAHSIKVAPNNGTFDFATLKSELVKIKLKNPEIFRAELLPETSVAFSDIVKTMDSMRSSEVHEFVFFDKTKNGEVRTKLMFPDIVFSSITGGIE